ncbi:MAG: AEC family transporter [Clostridium sp.]|uniref:AEC family transporter n=1 Tax=Clostridium sp. TaxID=1506 RepID=UPI00290C77FD|nr:AEC family transporter [Clostridium sp.]MDU7338968.1 AEC family transporter [Clostridium sp.]
MLASILTVAEKVFVMFLMMGLGYLCYYKRIITSRGAAQLTNLLLYIVGPCLIITALQGNSGSVSTGNILLTIGLFLVGMIAAAIAMQLLFRSQSPKRAGMLRYGVVYTNCGFMGLPLAQAILGNAGVVYASACLVAFNLLTWTHGYLLLGGGGDDRRQMLKNALLNPGTISFAVGLPLFAFSLQLPEPIMATMDSVGAMNTPLAMIVVGTYLAQLKIKEIFSDREVLKVTVLRLVVVPAVFLVPLWLLQPDSGVLITTVLLMAAPVGMNSVLFAIKLGNDVPLACKMVAMSTLLSIFTMPVVAAVAQRLATAA